MIIYIHGFGGSGEGGKAKILKEELKQYDNIIAPSLPSNPYLAILTLKELIESFLKVGNVYLVGSSLGGFYSLCLAAIYKIPAVVINPAVVPYDTLTRALGYAPNFYDGSTYEWNKKHIDILKSLEPQNFYLDKLLVLLQKEDELLDYKDAVKKLDGAKFIIEDGGNHSFDGIERHIDTIADFFGFKNKNSKLDSEFLKSVLTFATISHGEQKTPLGYPYLQHITSVATEVYFGMKQDLQDEQEARLAFCVALLHDVIEDTNTKYEDVKNAFGDLIANGVLALTKDKAKPSKQEQMQDSLNRIKKEPSFVACVKLADRITNLTNVPTHWDNAKKQKYKNEALMIYNELSFASKTLGDKLMDKINSI